MTNRQKLALTVCLLTVLAVIQGCPSINPPQLDPSVTKETGHRIVSISETLIGSPYRFGGDTPKGFDCSGLVRYIYGQIGIEAPHSSRKLYQQSIKVPLDRVQPGDLLFFRIKGKTVSHVAIYTQNSRFIHAPSSGKGVSTGSLNLYYWSSRLVGAGRLK